MPQRLIALLIFVFIVVSDALPQETTTALEPTAAETAAPAAVTTTANPSPFTDSNETREELMTVLNRFPPQVARVLKLDATLFSNPSYLANYPALQQFVAKHSEVAHNTAFYLEGVWVPNDFVPESASVRVWRGMIEGISIFAVFVTITGAIVWLIRTLIEHRRWSRISRTQAEVHNKLMDRFSSTEELMAYMQTPGGKRFLETGVVSLEPAPQRAVSAPIGRILWSVQIGVVVIAAGIGLQIISRMAADKEITQPMLAMGVLAAAIGTGFLISALVSYVLSKRLGLMGPGDAEAMQRGE
jgi:hypothetical protein